MVFRNVFNIDLLCFYGNVDIYILVILFSTKVMTIEKTGKTCNNVKLEQVNEFSYLGGIITEDEECEKT